MYSACARAVDERVCEERDSAWQEGSDRADRRMGSGLDSPAPRLQESRWSRSESASADERRRRVKARAEMGTSEVEVERVVVDICARRYVCDGVCAWESGGERAGAEGYRCDVQGSSQQDRRQPGQSRRRRARRERGP